MPTAALACVHRDEAPKAAEAPRTTVISSLAPVTGPVIGRNFQNKDGRCLERTQAPK